MDNKYFSRDNLELVIDGLKVTMTKDWNENDKSAVGYIENRPFYTAHELIVDNYSGGPTPKCNFIAGGTYNIIWNGVTYNGLVCHSDGEYNYIGGDGYPFYIDDNGGNSLYVSPENNFKVSISGTVIHQLDNKYIPNNIARTDYVEHRLIDLNGSLSSDIANTNANISSLETKVDANISSLETKVDANISSLETLETKVDENAADMMVYKQAIATMPMHMCWNNLVYGDGKYVATGWNVVDNIYTNSIVYSYDGINWNETTLPFYAIDAQYHCSEIVYGNGKFIAISNPVTSISDAVYSAYSTDGITWSELTTPVSIIALCYGNGKFIGVPSNNNKAIYSTDGITWLETTMPQGQWTKAVYGNDKFVVITSNISNRVAYSYDGITWSESTMPVSAYWWGDITYAKDKFIAIGSKSSMAMGRNNIVCHSSDGITWTQVNYDAAIDHIFYANGKFIGYYGSSYYYSDDAITWTKKDEKNFFTNRYSNIIYDGSKFITVEDSSSDPNRVVYSNDGLNWHYKDNSKIIQNNTIITENIKNLILDENVLFEGDAVPVPSTATIGQVVRVSEVDEDGKPIKWEAVDLPSNVNASAITLQDTETGSIYTIQITNGKLTMNEVTV